MIHGKRILVALDDGHGLNTAGKRTPTLPNGQTSEIGLHYMNENLFNRKVVEYLKEELEHCGFDVLLVAPNDGDTPLNVRTNLANLKKADIYISVHANAISGQWGNWGGIETFYYPSAGSKRLASILHKHLMQGTPFADRGVKNGSHLWVLRKTNMPAALLELGFMDSLKDYKELLKDSYRRESAQEACKGVCEYFDTPYIPLTGKPITASNPVAKPGKPVLKTGSEGADVRDLQTLLLKHKITVAVDGVFGPNTDKAVRAFQKTAKLTVDGIVGENTWKRLAKDPVVAAPKPAPKPEPKPAPKPAPVKDCGCDLDCDCHQATVKSAATDNAVYRVVAGSFSTKKEANERVALLKKKGVDAFVSAFKDGGKTHYRVVAGTFNDRKNAEAQAAKLAKLKIESFLLAETN